MKHEIQKKLTLFAQNAQIIENRFIEQNTMTKQLAALLYAQENEPINCDAILDRHALLKSNDGVFSMFKGNMSLCIAALYSLEDTREYLLNNIKDVYDRMKAKFHVSDYLAVAAYYIAANTAHYNRTVNRTKAFYDGKMKYPLFYTDEDYIYSAMLGLSDIDITDGMKCIELLYNRLKSEFWDRNEVQWLSQVLALSRKPDETTNRVLALRDALRNNNLCPDRLYSLPSLGVLALLSVDIDTITEDILEAQLFLRSQKGFEAVTPQDLLLFSAAIVASGYVEDFKQGMSTASLSTSIVNIIIAQQAAIIAATPSVGAMV